MAKKYRIMYIEAKDGINTFHACIGKITFSKSGKSLYYKDIELHSLNGSGWKSNYADQEGRHYWVSGCRKDGNDGHYKTDVFVDENIRTEYWTEIRKMPERAGQNSFTSRGKHRVGRQDLKNKTGNL